MPILGSCCFCFDLKVGTKIIGVLALIAALINSIILAGVVVMFVLMGVGLDVVDKIRKESQPTPDFEDDDYTDVREVEGTPMLELVQNHIASVTIVVYVLLALCLLCVITSSMLIHGVKRNRRGLLTPYIVQEILNVIVLGSLSIWSLVVFEGQATIVYSVIGIVVFMAVHIYFALVVISQYQALGLIRMHEEISMK